MSKKKTQTEERWGRRKVKEQRREKALAAIVEFADTPPEKRDALRKLVNAHAAVETLHVSPAEIAQALANQKRMQAQMRR